ncbi:MAG: hypothetical protein JWP37_4552 [Mucilaginibacter sp.]|nr:hypothetical protein [Mucilaginibacter sp.]
MTPVQWIGLGCLAFLLITLCVTLFSSKNISSSQHNTLKFFTALSAAFSGGFLTGEALFSFDKTMGNGVHLVISGTAGCALFFTIWFTYAKYKDPNPPPPPKPNPEINFEIPPGWSFEHIVEKILLPSGGTYEISGFTPDEKKSILKAQLLKTPSAKAAIERLKFLSTTLPKYSVTENQNHFEIIKI